MRQPISKKVHKAQLAKLWVIEDHWSLGGGCDDFDYDKERGGWEAAFRKIIIIWTIKHFRLRYPIDTHF